MLINPLCGMVTFYRRMEFILMTMFVLATTLQVLYCTQKCVLPPVKRPSTHTHTESLSEAVKVLKAEYLVKAISTLKMDQAIIFCRTKLDCDNVENYLMSLGGGLCDPLQCNSVCIHVSLSIPCSGPHAMVNEYSCVCLHGDRRPQERKANLKAFKV